MVERRNRNHQIKTRGLVCLRIARNWQFRGVWTKVLTVWRKVGAVPADECSQDETESPTQKFDHLVQEQARLA